MAYNTGSITSATPASALAAVIETELTSHAAWTSVENVTIGSNDYRVWKCEGSANFVATDFYIVLKYLTAGTGVVSIGGGEVYDSGANTMLRPITAVTTTPHTDWSESATARALDHASCTYPSTGTLNTTGFTWYTVVGDSFVSWGCRVGATDVGGFGGCFDTIVTVPGTNDPLPIVASGSAAGPQSSRHPLLTSANATNFDMVFDVLDETVYTGTTLVDLFQAKPIAGKVMVMGTPVSTHGNIRGFLLDCIGVEGAGSIVTGDTLTVGSDVYVLMHVGGNGAKETAFLKTASS